MKGFRSMPVTLGVSYMHELEKMLDFFKEHHTSPLGYMIFARQNNR